MTLSERARLRELEREVRELRMKTEFPGKEAAFFASMHQSVPAADGHPAGPISEMKTAAPLFAGTAVCVGWG